MTRTRLLGATAVAIGALAVAVFLAWPSTESGPPCPPDDSRHLVQVVYVEPPDAAHRPEDAAAKIKGVVREANSYLAASGPGHHVRWACNNGELHIARVDAPPVGDDGEFTYPEVVAAVRDAGHDRMDRLYALFYPEGAGYPEVGEASGGGDASQGPQYAFTVEWTGFWVLHEVGHTLGAVPSKAPHQYERGHCYELNDVMCRRLQDKDDPAYDSIAQFNCPDAPEWFFDCNHDDYYMHDGDWWDVADSPYLYLDAESQAQ